MGFKKKPAATIDHDEEIRREIRARVAKQVGIYDQEYIETGKIGGIPVITETKQGEAELSFEPIKEEPAPEEPIKVEPAPEEPIKVEPAPEEPIKEEPAPEEPIKEEPAPEELIKEEPAPNSTVAKNKQKPAKGASEMGSVKPARKKWMNAILILLILALIVAFVPVYYYLTGIGTL
jgi:hypothetical protein